MTNDFAAWLDRTLSNQGVGSARALAERLGVSDSRVSKWRAGQATPHFDMVVKVALALDVDPMRLAANAGRLPAELQDQYQPLPIPPVREEEKIKHQIMGWKGISLEAKKRILEIYEQDIANGEEDSDEGEADPD